VAVGLLGKIFGPIGFFIYGMRGELPWRAGWTILTNDLIWWIPFTLILIKALKVEKISWLPLFPAWVENSK
jgi:hypothetical protein